MKAKALKFTRDFLLAFAIALAAFYVLAHADIWGPVIDNYGVIR